MNEQGHDVLSYTYPPQFTQNTSKELLEKSSRQESSVCPSCEQRTRAEPFVDATMPSQGPENQRGGNSQGMLNISWAGRHSLMIHTQTHES